MHKKTLDQFNIVTQFEVKEDASSAEVITIEGYGSFCGQMDEDGKGAFVDFAGDVVLIDGLDLKWFKQNPVILWQHEREEVIGQAVQVIKKKEGLWIKAEIHKSAMDPEDFYKIQAGLVKQFSIGFKVSKIEWRKVGDREVCFITKSELREVSCVTIACNAMSNYSVMKAYGTEGFFAGELFEESKQDSHTTTEEEESAMKVKFRDLLPAEKVKELEELGLVAELDEEREISLVKYLEKYRTELEASVKNIVLTTLKEVEDKAKEEAEAKAKADLEAEKEKTQAELAEKLGLTVEEIKAMTEEEIEAKIKELTDSASEEDVKELGGKFDDMIKALEDVTKTLTSEEE